jgi:hypothetical protein
LFEDQGLINENDVKPLGLARHYLVCELEVVAMMTKYELESGKTDWMA